MPAEEARSGRYAVSSVHESDVRLAFTTKDGKTSTAQFKLDNDHIVLGHVAGKMRRFRIRILPGDRVRCELSPYDLDRARIVYRHR